MSVIGALLQGAVVSYLDARRGIAFGWMVLQAGLELGAVDMVTTRPVTSLDVALEVPVERDDAGQYAEVAGEARPEQIRAIGRAGQAEPVGDAVDHDRSAGCLPSRLGVVFGAGAFLGAGRLGSFGSVGVSCGGVPSALGAGTTKESGSRPGMAITRAISGSNRSALFGA